MKMAQPLSEIQQMECIGRRRWIVSLDLDAERPRTTLLLLPVGFERYMEHHKSSFTHCIIYAEWLLLIDFIGDGGTMGGALCSGAYLDKLLILVEVTADHSFFHGLSFFSIPVPEHPHHIRTNRLSHNGPQSRVNSQGRWGSGPSPPRSNQIPPKSTSAVGYQLPGACRSELLDVGLVSILGKDGMKARQSTFGAFWAFCAGS
ncbi:uncharacterized protein BCR38DRAFT_507308 [Pseudomassariella vexata]|uniref:Uncharacterized protein n=1 Tax=Pseudomassariella vexata TaxID=1141098 RepID=A0A1Y2EA57_9PEZI|nr:uncharacterized protein BCR38DRAFT_507308 [Pseudomassariella vexata]ORY68451.1 hypothetical protein BCR38DRAFT_507308 [Pseudomassariella vexata]